VIALFVMNFGWTVDEVLSHSTDELLLVLNGIRKLRGGRELMAQLEEAKRKDFPIEEK